MLVAALLLVGLAGCGGGDGPEPAAARAELGSRPLVERTVEQLEADLETLRGRVVVVNFWASWCEPCKQEMPALQRVSEAYADAPVTVIGVDSGDVRSDAEAFLRQAGVTFPTVYDPKGPQGGIASRWQVTGLPQTWFVAKDGSRASRYASAISEEELRRRIDQLLAA